VIVPVTLGASHLYCVFEGTIFPPATPTAGDTWNSIPLQVTVVNVTNSGVGFNVTTTVNTEPAQMPDIGVTL
jgi:hypothetical protein